MSFSIGTAMLAKNTRAASGYWRAVTSSSTPPRIVLGLSGAELHH